ncbi:MAG: FecR family protein [Carboxylicivirga sp.]|jgi:ferric-dicitrate binding protein FerR (iron transport regulator)|nr:FecR family protein [Carboxylicivirga sp.]
MKQENSHNEQWTNDDDFMKSMPKVELPYSRSKADVWESMEEMLGDENQAIEPKIEMSQKKGKVLRPLWLSMAAIFLLLIGTSVFFRLYTKTVHANAGQHLTALLPDGSSIELNAGSVIKYKPLWWRFNREVQFEGEGFFKVQKGESFEVVSSMGRTIVLGTSFNIYARKNEYKVTCYTGKVRVVSVVSGNSTDITPNMQASVQSNGQVFSSEEGNTEATIYWMQDQFHFTATPLNLVFEEVERQYGVQIVLKDNLNENYSGNFTLDRSVEDVMYNICRPMGLTFKKTPNGFLVSQKN